jgi:hypothetical protein
MALPITRNDSLEHGDLAALLCIDDAQLQATVIEQVTQLGFGVHTALFAEEVGVRLRSRGYDVVIVSENFGGSDAESNPALHEIANVPMNQRRESFVILIGPTMVTRSEMQAFMYSVDLVVKKEDAANLKTIAGRGIVRQEEFYATFLSVQKAVRAS